MEDGIARCQDATFRTGRKAERPAVPIGDAPAGHHRRRVRQAARGQRTGLRLQDEFARRPVAVRAGQTPGRDRQHHEPRVRIGQRIRVGQLAGVHHEVGVGKQ